MYVTTHAGLTAADAQALKQRALASAIHSYGTWSPAHAPPAVNHSARPDSAALRAAAAATAQQLQLILNALNGAAPVSSPAVARTPQLSTADIALLTRLLAAQTSSVPAPSYAPPAAPSPPPLTKSQYQLRNDSASAYRTARFQPAARPLPPHSSGAPAPPPPRRAATATQPVPAPPAPPARPVPDFASQWAKAAPFTPRAPPPARPQRGTGVFVPAGMRSEGADTVAIGMQHQWRGAGEWVGRASAASSDAGGAASLGSPTRSNVSSVVDLLPDEWEY